MCSIKLQKFQYACGKIVRSLKTSGKEPLFKAYYNGDTNVWENYSLLEQREMGIQMSEMQ